MVNCSIKTIKFQAATAESTILNNFIFLNSLFSQFSFFIYKLKAFKLNNVNKSLN